MNVLYSQGLCALLSSISRSSFIDTVNVYVLFSDFFDKSYKFALFVDPSCELKNYIGHSLEDLFSV